MFIGRTPPVAAPELFLVLPIVLPLLLDLFSFVIDRLNFIGESISLRFGLAWGESRAPKPGFRLFCCYNSLPGLLAGELAGSIIVIHLFYAKEYRCKSFNSLVTSQIPPNTTR